MPDSSPAALRVSAAAPAGHELGAVLLDVARSLAAAHRGIARAVVALAARARGTEHSGAQFRFALRRLGDEVGDLFERIHGFGVRLSPLLGFPLLKVQ